MSAYYNEIDPYAAQWLRNLIKAGHIADGVVDERSIEDVKPYELEGFTQCHFFAGIGVWSHSLRRAGWPDDREVWTGSCPCQPFSAAGKAGGFADERHLWPTFHHLIEQRRPAVVFGEQVASKDGLGWLDLVQADLEGTGYSCGPADICAAGLGAPHIRQRLWFVAERVGNALDTGLEGLTGHGDGSDQSGRQQTDASGSAGETGSDGRLADTESSECELAGTTRPGGSRFADCDDDVSRLADTERDKEYQEQQRSQAAEGGRSSDLTSGCSVDSSRPGPTNGFWRDADWLGCRDGKWRPVRPGSFPLVNGAASRVGRLRAYGNAINAEVATEFIAAYLAK